MKSLVKQLIEAALNQYLALDEESKERLLAMDGKNISIILKTPQQTKIHMNIQNGKITFSSHEEKYPDVLIEGTPLSLLHMSIAKENRQQFFAEDVLIKGDLELAQQIIALFDELEIDWEEYVSKMIGDIPAHQIGRLVRGIKKATNKMKESLIQNVNEYIHEERLIFPPVEALQDFFHDIDVLRMDSDRLAARILRLKNKISIKRD